MEEHVLNADGVALRYVVVRRKGMKNLRLRVSDKGEPVVSCSPRTSLERINAFVAKNVAWVQSEKKKIKDAGLLDKRKYVTAEKYLYAGKERMLVVLKGEREHVDVVDDYMALVIPDENDIERKRNLIDKWYRKKAKEVFTQRFYDCVEKYRNYFPDDYKLRIRQMKARWGSCIIDKKTVVLNFKLIYADFKYLDYVIMHELCHFYHKNHGAAFYGMLARFLPDHRELRKGLTNYYIRYSHL